MEELIASRYGGTTADRFVARHRDLAEDFEDLLRGNITEFEYWRMFLTGSRWPFGIKDLKRLLSENMRFKIPGTLSVSRRIVAYPVAVKQYLTDGDYRIGRPTIHIVSDHIVGRPGELISNHPDIFDLVHHRFWSCTFGMIKKDDGFFEMLLNYLRIPRDECIFIDDNPDNISAAQAADITSILFTGAADLENSLKSYGFRFSDPLCTL